LIPHKLNVLKDTQPTIYRHFFDRHSFNSFASITVSTQKQTQTSVEHRSWQGRQNVARQQNDKPNTLMSFIACLVYGGPYLQTQQTIRETQNNVSETQRNVFETQHNIF